MGVSAYLNELYNADGMLATSQVTGLPLGQIAAGGATATNSTTVVLGIAAPSWIVAGMPVYDVTAGAYVGAVASISGVDVTLAADAANAITSGDVLQFGFEPADIAAGFATPNSTDVRGLVQLVQTKMNESRALLNYLLNNVVTNSEDSVTHAILNSALGAL